jgi:hypothetical protein
MENIYLRLLWYKCDATCREICKSDIRAYVTSRNQNANNNLMCTDYHPCQEQILGIYTMSHLKNFPSDEKHSKRNEIWSIDTPGSDKRSLAER